MNKTTKSTTKTSTRTTPKHSGFEAPVYGKHETFPEGTIFTIDENGYSKAILPKDQKKGKK